MSFNNKTESCEKIKNIANEQKDFFATNKTKDISFRLKQLEILKKAIEANEDKIIKAVKADLGRNETEAYISEIAPVLSEIDYAVKNIKKWAKAKKVKTPFILFPAKSYVYPEPYGTVLIISPWNYPFQLSLSPLVGAIVSGNCAVIKPSELAPNSARIITDIVGNNFVHSYISAVEGGVDETQELLSQKFDYIFFTGGTRVGKIIMAKAAENLTPVALELGGKSPCIVDKDIDIKIAARRIVWGKYFNAGQTCTAPDYLLAHKSIKAKLLDEIKKNIEEFYGKDPIKSYDYARIINERHFDRLSELLKEGNIIAGGKASRANRYIAPTVIDNISWDYKIMQDEIFGPILPVIEYENLDDIIKIINNRPKPLALYFFSKDKARQIKIVEEISAGGVSINDIMAHIQNMALPFGGVGDSGIGAYHGKASFDIFTHYKSVCKRMFIAEPKIKFPPYKTPLKYLKKIIKLLS